MIAMKALLAVVVLFYVQLGAFCVLTGDYSSDALYTPFELQDVQKGYKHQTVFTYPTAESSCNFEIIEQPTRRNLWNNYFVPLVGDGSYIRPIKANCETEVFYQKEILDQPDCCQSSSTISTSWAPLGHPVVIRPTPSAKPKLEVVKVGKSALSEALNLANLLYRNEPINYSETRLTKPNKQSEVVVNVNLGSRKELPGKKGLVNQFKDLVQKKVDGIVDPVKKVVDQGKKNLPVVQKVDNSLPVNSEMDPDHLLKSGKIQLKETHLSEHDSIVEVILPPKSGNQPSDQEPCESKQESENNSSGSTEVDSPTSSCDSNGIKSERPIIKNRFVVLHLKEGEKMIKDPLIKFLAKV